MAIELKVCLATNDVAAVRAALDALGPHTIAYCDEVDYKPVPKPAVLTWVYISPDEDAGYREVTAEGETDGSDISDYRLQDLRHHGVVTEFYTMEPRFDRYGVPDYASDSIQAARCITSDLFAVAPSLTVTCLDRGDDGPTDIWLCIAMPS